MGENITYFFTFFHKIFAIPKYSSYIYYIQKRLTMNTAQPTERQIKETLAASGKTSIKDLVNYGTGKFPTVDAKTIRAFAKELR